MKKLSLRMRVTLITAAAMVIICLLLSSLILYNADTWIIGSTGVSDVSEEIADEELLEQDFIIELDSVYSVQQFYLATWIAVAGVLMVGVTAVYFATGIALKPVNTLCSKISALDGQNQTRRIEDFSAGKELTALANSFNQLLERIDAAFQREKSFSAGAAHELKTPLAVMKTNLDVLALSEVPTPEEYAETVQVVTGQVQRMTKLVDDLFSLCTLGSYEISETVSIDRLMGEIIAEQQGNAQHIRWEVTLTPCHVKANSVMLKHALSNLVQNAIKYNIDGASICITSAVNGGQCMLSVADTGIGISPEAAAHIFEPFYREDKSRSRKMGGAGLGLSIAENILTQHGGTLSYHPNHPKGAVFVAELPVYGLRK